MKKNFRHLCATFTALAAILVWNLIPAYARTIVDMRGLSIEVPDEPRAIATIDDGFIEGVMTHLGVIDRVCAIASWSMKRDYRYTYTGKEGATYEYQGVSTMRCLHPWLDQLPCFNSLQGNMLNFETLASVSPDLVILRVGDTPVGTDKEKVTKTINTIERLGIPLLVLFSPTWYRDESLASIRQEASIIGEVFGQKQKAEALADYLNKTELMIRSRTQDIPARDKPRILFLGLRPDVRKKGGAGTVHGIDSPESYIIERIVNAQNAYQGRGSSIPISAEQVYACDPDVIILPTANGYHPPRELYEAPYYAILRELRAVKEKRAYAMPWTPMNASRRVEYPLEMLIVAKAAYPERFSDICVYDLSLQFYKDVYGVDDTLARKLRSAQMLDWMQEARF